MFNIQIFAVLTFIILYLVQNFRRPLMLSYLSEKIDSRVMASGLSAESQIETILVSVYAPALGWLVDVFGLGAGLLLSSLFFFAAFPLIRLPDNASYKSN